MSKDLTLIKNPSQEADFSRLPEYFTSDKEYDSFANEYFIRHLSVDERGVYWGKGPRPGSAILMWDKEWDSWFFPWLDRGAMGLKRENYMKTDGFLYTFLNTPVDKYGYVWAAPYRPEPRDLGLNGAHLLFGWPWPKYNWNLKASQPTGWEFLEKGANEEQVQQCFGWSSNDIALQIDDSTLKGTIDGENPDIISPKFSVESFQVPIVEIDIEYESFSDCSVDDVIGEFRLYWSTEKEGGFSEEKSVGVDFSALPPDEYGEYYRPWVSREKARYVLLFPMYLHSKWGKEEIITGLKIVPLQKEKKDINVRLNYVRATYDTRMSTSNTSLIYGFYRYFMWSGDEEFLRAMMPKLRRAMLFLNEHLKGKEDKLLNFGWMVGKDGLGGENIGHGLIGNYWDLLPAGYYDLESSTSYYTALLAMAELERSVSSRKIDVPKVSVIGPDNKSGISYTETPDGFESHACAVKEKIEETFWLDEPARFCRNIDINGNKHDYGFLHFNLLSLVYGIGTDKQRNSILSWLDGRLIPSDTSTGEDIYRWRFAPRTTTKRNEDYYFWPWIEGMKKEFSDIHKFGNQMQDGGAVPFTSLFDLVVRTRSKKQEQIDKAFNRTLEIKEWFFDVKSAGGQGSEFYRTYYGGHPERGLQQGGDTPGGLGLDREFMSDAAIGTTFIPFAFLGIEAKGDKVLSVQPAIPSQLEKVGVRNVYYHRNYLTIEAGKDYVSFKGSKMVGESGLQVEVTFMCLPDEYSVQVDGCDWNQCIENVDGTLTVITPLKESYIQVCEK